MRYEIHRETTRENCEICRDAMQYRKLRCISSPPPSPPPLSLFYIFGAVGNYVRLMIYIRSNDIGRLQLVQRIIRAIISIASREKPISHIHNL